MAGRLRSSALGTKLASSGVLAVFGLIALAGSQQANAGPATSAASHNGLQSLSASSVKPASVSDGAARALSTSVSRLGVADLKVMNYYPAQAPWTKMWTDFPAATIDQDFTAVRSLGANAVRIIVQPAAVGYPVPTAAGATRLRTMVDLAAQHGLRVQFSLFDWWQDYADVAGSSRWLASILRPYRNDGRIALIELRNEIQVGNAGAMAWARQLLSQLPRVLPGVPRTVSIAGSQDRRSMQQLDAQLPASLLDVIDVHLYGRVTGLAAKLASAQAVAHGRPIFVGEAGAATATGPTSCSQATQSRFFQAMLTLARQYHVAAVAPWTLNDFEPSAMPRPNEPAAEANFGLRRLDGSWKPAASAVRALYAGLHSAGPTAIAGVDGSFDCAGLSRTVDTGLWRVFDPTAAAGYGIAKGDGIAGSAAGFLRHTAGDARQSPALAQTLGVLGRHKISATVQVRLAGATGRTRVALAWFAGSKYLGSLVSAPAANAAAGWQNLAVAGVTPAGTTSVQVHLQSAGNAGTAYFDNAAVTD